MSTTPMTLDRMLTNAARIAERYPAANLAPPRFITDTVSDAEKRHGDWDHVADAWVAAYRARGHDDLGRYEVVLVAAALGGWAGDALIHGHGDRLDAFRAVAELCGVDARTVSEVFFAVDSVTPLDPPRPSDLLFANHPANQPA